MAQIRCLVTGGAGFIGSHIIENLLKLGHEVVCIDNFDVYYDPQLKRKNIDSFMGNELFELVEGDFRNRGLLKKALNGVEYVFHEAAQAGVRISVEAPMKPHEINATGTLNLLEAVLDSDVKKVINASSSSVYGKVEYLPFDENHPNQPVSPYGVSKLLAEHYCRVFEELYGLKTVSLRYFTVYGPRMRPDLAISIFTKAALKNKPITIFGNGEKTRDFTHVDDIVRANLICMEKGSGVYNIGAGNSISINELARKIIEINKSKSTIFYADPVKGDAEHTLASSEKAWKELGWKPEVTVKEGLERYAKWMSNSRKANQMLFMPIQ
ncbi:SDR family oxidoreductase [Methanosarcina sp. KYL-1]|uniref:SDR family oxidoreductase n=1 Tax=Methanosarcina sp. KYL-1 TaxID=2602068 RepID=UPI002100F585|nr:SDR family oxidoreductase [Methanosarcina sp. KYL-1]MCQ1536886.1 SDR family oxidoreductase [Methanosarcina sp. KYL-1]